MGQRSARREQGQREPDPVEAALSALRSAPDDRLEDALDAAASALTAAPGGWEAVSRMVVAAAERGVRRCWDGGWQPADLVRIVRRERGAAPVRFITDMIAAEARRQPARGTDARKVDARWAGQLRELDARVWWDGDGAYLDGFARRERPTSRFETASCVLDVLRLIGRLPRITPVGRPAQRRQGDEPRMLGRVRALLAKAESTSYPEEAEALSAKAQELMARYSIDEALVEADAHGGPGTCRIGVDAPYESAKALLLDAVAEANRCQAVWASELGFSTVVGFDADLEHVELLYTSLLLQATTAMRQAADDHHARGRARRTRNFRESFLIAYAGRIRDRLAAATRQVTEQAMGTDHVLPVLAAREVAVGAATERMFPDTTAHRLKCRDAEGWAHGTAAADRTELP
ncbi:DUF2786 domain-containing protein [Streptomyces sp. XD-27]|uniref:DUF2786 domain-containing protein n=1 Tax=Streptomyces sp. XD-27 TaxID=3062779 RepID=UPI0026F45B8A|nr:DUF2786 domain-containing protein [Streptomyces sp. XD-27]WKX69232.1 DUF2786 domain-containing protein [Streptomyces sp. XD-27]